MFPLNIYTAKRNYATFLAVMDELKSDLSQNRLTGNLSLQFSSFRLGKKIDANQKLSFTLLHTFE